MPTFEKITMTSRGHTLEYDYLLKVQTEQELMFWYENVQAKNINRGVEDFMFSKDCDYLLGRTESRYSHIRTDMGRVIRNICDVSALKGENKKIWEIAADFVGKVVANMWKCLETYGTLYISPTGAYFYPVGEIAVMDTITKDDFVFPNSTMKINITKWPEGKHFYARIDHLDVKDSEGNLKWNTHEEAYKQAVLFREKLQKGK